jgi:GWxTD domain-containing protein
MELKDTLITMPDFIDLQRFPLETGNYQVDMSVSDNNDRKSKNEQRFEVVVDYTDGLLKFSDLQLVDYFIPTKEENVLSKSGYDLVPYVGDYYPQAVSVMNGYVELYNLNKIIGENQDFLFRYYVESAKDSVLIENLIKGGRHKSASVNPLLFTVSISELPHGYYNLVVEAIDRNNKVLAKRKVSFFRTNPGLQVDEAVIKTIDITATFAEQIHSVDSLRFYLLSVIPVATSSENLYIHRLVQTDNVLQMQKTLFSFWKKRNDKYPNAEWNHYKKQVMAIEERYKTKIKHGFETDMGYTWLRYGTPDQVEDSKHEPLAAPYIIWKYFHIENQSDVRFVFTNPHLVGTEYFLIYSNARDNPYNRGWDRDVYERTSGFGAKGGWGSRIQSNFDR